MLYLAPMSKEELVRNVKLKGKLVCSDHEITEYDTLRAMRMVYRKLSTWEFGKANFGLLITCLVEYCGIKPWREEGTKKAG